MAKKGRGIIKVMHSIIRDVDPLRGIATAQVEGLNFFVNQNGITAVVVRRHSDGQEAGRVVPTGRGGDILVDTERVAEYFYDELSGYTVIPLRDGVPDMDQACSEHPLDFLLRQLVSRA